MDWQFLWQAEAQDLRVALMEAIDSAAVSAINEPHVPGPSVWGVSFQKVELT